MEPAVVRVLFWFAAFAVTWISARAIVAVLRSNASDNSKASWIAGIVCAPVVGPLVYWLCSGGGEFSTGTPQGREALLKARMNRDETAA
jgi:hypothetical protein